MLVLHVRVEKTMIIIVEVYPSLQHKLDHIQHLNVKQYDY